MKTTYLANKILTDNMDDNYIAFFTGDPSAGGQEIIPDNEERHSIDWSAPNGGYMANSSVVLVKADASNGSEKVANYWGIYDNKNVGSGNLLYYFPIGYDVLCEIGVDVEIGVGSLILKEA